MIKCSVAECNWCGYHDTKKCYGHSGGEVVVDQPTRALESYPDDGIYTYTEELARKETGGKP